MHSFRGIVIINLRWLGYCYISKRVQRDMRLHVGPRVDYAYPCLSFHRLYNNNCSWIGDGNMTDVDRRRWWPCSDQSRERCSTADAMMDHNGSFSNLTCIKKVVGSIHNAHCFGLRWWWSILLPCHHHITNSVGPHSICPVSHGPFIRRRKFTRWHECWGNHS